MTTPAQQQQIQELAYQLWEQEGRPEGRDREHWERAQRQLQGEEPGVMSEATPSSAAPGDNAVLSRPQPTPGVVKDGVTGRSRRPG